MNTYNITVAGVTYQHEAIDAESALYFAEWKAKNEGLEGQKILVWAAPSPE